MYIIEDKRIFKSRPVRNLTYKEVTPNNLRYRLQQISPNRNCQQLDKNAYKFLWDYGIMVFPELLDVINFISEYTRPYARRHDIFMKYFYKITL